MKRVTVRLFAVVLALLIAGCGSSSDDTTEGTDGGSAVVEQLLDRVPGGARSIAAMDMATAKRQLGVTADLDPRRYGEYTFTATPEEQFTQAVVPEVLNYLVTDTSPFSRALDHGKVRAAVSANLIPGGQLVILTTTQPREEIEKRLLRAGLRRAGENGFLRKKDESTFAELTAAVLDDDIVVLAESLEIASGVVRKAEPDPGLKRARRLLAATRGALRIVRMFPDPELNPGAPCLRGVAGGEIFTPGNPDEDLVLALSGEPRPSEVTLGRGAQLRDVFTKYFRVSDVSRSGGMLALKLRTVPGATTDNNAARVAEGALEPHLFYRCPGAAAARERRRLAKRKALFPPPPGPDRSGSRLETRISGYIAALSAAPNAIRVRCPVQTLPRGTRTLKCTGTRPHKRGRYHYKLTVAFEPNGAIKYVEPHTNDDKTGTIVTNEKDDKSTKQTDGGT